MDAQWAHEEAEETDWWGQQEQESEDLGAANYDNRYGGDRGRWRRGDYRYGGDRGRWRRQGPRGDDDWNAMWDGWDNWDNNNRWDNWDNNNGWDNWDNNDRDNVPLMAQAQPRCQFTNCQTQSKVRP